MTLCRWHRRDSEGVQMKRKSRFYILCILLVLALSGQEQQNEYRPQQGYIEFHESYPFSFH